MLAYGSQVDQPRFRASASATKFLDSPTYPALGRQPAIHQLLSSTTHCCCSKRYFCYAVVAASAVLGICLSVVATAAMMDFIIKFAQAHETFRIPEIEALAMVENVPLKIIQSDEAVRCPAYNNYDILIAGSPPYALCNCPLQMQQRSSFVDPSWHSQFMNYGALAKTWKSSTNPSERQVAQSGQDTRTHPSSLCLIRIKGRVPSPASCL